MKRTENGDTITSLRKALKRANKLLRMATSRLVIVSAWARMGGPSGRSVSEANVRDIERIASETVKKIRA